MKRSNVRHGRNFLKFVNAPFPDGMSDMVMRGPDGKRRKVFLAIHEPDELAQTLENLGAEVVKLDPSLSVSELKKIYDDG